MAIAIVAGYALLISRVVMTNYPPDGVELIKTLMWPVFVFTFSAYSLDKGSLPISWGSK